MDPAVIVDGFLSSHSELDVQRRRQLLDSSITDDAEFHGLQQQLFGRAEIEAGFVGTSHLVRTSDVDVRGRWLRWEWEYRKPDGEPERALDGSVYGGAAIGLLGADDRLRLVVPFLGTRP